MRVASQLLRSATPSPVSAEIMKVESNLAFSLAILVNNSSVARGTRSILLRIRIFVGFTSASRASSASASSSMPLRASISTPTRSASCAPLQAVVTMARSSRRFGAKMPGVSTKMSCALPSIVMPRMSARVVCTLCETMVTFEPTRALSSVDLPALGAPISATKPQRVSSLGDLRSTIQLVHRHALPGEHGGGGRLFGGALRRAQAFGRRAVGQRHRDAELRVVIRAGASQFLVIRRRQPAALRPFLQHGFRIAQWPQRLEHALLPVARDQGRSGGVTAVGKYRPDQAFAGIRQNGRARAAAGVRFRTAELERRSEIH